MWSLRLLFNGKEADFDSKLGIDFEFANPMFTETRFNTDFTFSFSLPFTAKNKRLFGYKNRIDTPRISQYDFKLVIPAGVFLEGVAMLNFTGDDVIRVNVESYGIELLKKMEEKDLKNIPMDSFQIFDPEDAPEVNDIFDAWNAHQFLCNFTQAATEGSHKWPQIWTAGYDGDFSGKTNYIHALNANVVNPIAETNFQHGWGVFDDDKPKPEDKWWPYTKAPCPRIMYLVDQVLSYFSVNKKTGDLWSEEELNQMVCFAGVVMDQIYEAQSESEPYISGVSLFPPFIEYSTDIYPWEINVYGSSFNLADFVPEVKIKDLFQLLIDTRGAYFVVSKSSIYAGTLRDALNSKPVDVTQWTGDELGAESEEVTEPNVFYEEYEANKIKGVLLTTWDYVGEDFLVDDSGAPYNPHPDEKNEEYPIAHYPMKSNHFITEGYVKDRANYLYGPVNERVGWGELMPRFWFPYQIGTLGEKNDARQDRFHVGYYRGVHSTVRFFYEPIGDPTETYNTCWPYSWDQTNWDPRNTVNGFTHQFGTSLYLTQRNGTMENWLKYYYKQLYNADLVTVKMNMPDHELLQFIRFERIKHIIQQKRGSFAGVLDKISGKITPQGIQDVEFTYRVAKSVLYSGDTNEDFSNDFNG